MSDEQFKRAIQRIAEQDIGDDMNRWNEIYAQLDLPVTRPAPRWTRAAAVVAFLLIGLTMTGLSVYAFSRLFWLDPGIEAIDETGLVEQLNQSQTIDGVTITLERGYVDENRIVVWFFISGLETPSGQIRGIPFEPEISYQGRPFEHSLDVAYTAEKLTKAWRYQLNITHQETTLLGETVDLRLTFSPSSSGVFVFPDMVNPNRNNVDWKDYKSDLNITGRFQFDFTLPVSHEIRLEPMQTVTVEGISLQLRRLEIAPSSTYIILCHDGDIDYKWTLQAKLRFDNGLSVPMRGLSSELPRTNADDMICIEGNIPIASLNRSEVAEVTAWFDKNYTAEPILPENTDLTEARVRLSEQGIEVEFIIVDGDVNWHLLKKPDDMSISQLEFLISGSLWESRRGAWVFNVALPE